MFCMFLCVLQQNKQILNWKYITTNITVYYPVRVLWDTVIFEKKVTMTNIFSKKRTTRPNYSRLKIWIALWQAVMNKTFKSNILQATIQLSTKHLNHNRDKNSMTVIITKTILYYTMAKDIMLKFDSKISSP